MTFVKYCYNYFIIEAVLIVGILAVLVLLVLLRKHFTQILSVLVFVCIAFFGWGMAKQVLFTPEQKITIETQEQNAMNTVRKITNYFQTGTGSLLQLREQVTQLVEKSQAVKNSTFVSTVQKLLQQQDITLPAEIAILFTEKSVQEFNDLPPIERQQIKEQVATTIAEQKIEASTATVDEPPKDAQVVKQGLFTDAYALKSAQGLVTIYTGINQTFTVYIQELEVPYGPNLGLYLAQVNPLTNEVDQTFIFVGPLKSTSGNQSYVLPTEVDVTKYDTVFIYSPPLDTVYAAAPMR